MEGHDWLKSTVHCPTVFLLFLFFITSSFLNSHIHDCQHGPLRLKFESYKYRQKHIITIMCKSGSSGSARPVSVAGTEAGPGRGNFTSLTDWLVIRLRIITRMSVLLTRRYWVNAVSCCLSHSASVLSVDPFLHNHDNASQSLVPRFRLTFGVT